MKRKIYYTIICIYTVLYCSSCEKYLDVKPDKKLVVPENLDDLQALLDNFNNIQWDPAIGEVSSDDYYLNDSDWNSLSSERDRRSYIWERENIYPSLTFEWFRPYRNVYYANVVLENLKHLGRENVKNTEKWDYLRGQALFLRGRSFLSIALIFANAYNVDAASDLGIPIRLTSDFNILSTRESLDQTYQQVIDDLTEAVDLLPAKSLHVYRSSKPAAQALLARVYLFMRDYEKSLFYAEECLKLKSDLLDFNELDESLSFPIPEFNSEIIYHSIMYAPPLSSNIAKIDSGLIMSYETGDLRRIIFFRENADSTNGFRGSYYSTANNLFSGLAVDEIYLIRAECYARMGVLDLAKLDLNTLLSKRWEKNSFKPIEISNQDDLLEVILLERRKELLMRGLRLPDVKRLNLENRNVSFLRKINGNEYILEPNSPHFTLPIPEEVIHLTGIPQNP